MKIQIMINGKRREPYELDSLKKAYALGQLPVNALAWDEGTSRWVPLGELPALRAPASASTTTSASAPPAATSAGTGQTSRASGSWYYHLRGSEPMGPVAEDELRRLITEGTVPANAQVFRQGTAGWVPVSEFKTASERAAEAAAAVPSASEPTQGKSFSTSGSGGENLRNRAMLRNVVALSGIGAAIFILLLLTYTPANAYKLSDGRWMPLPGYAWRSESALFKTTEWKPGLVHPASSHLHAGKSEGDWINDLGFEAVHSGREISVVWMPGDRFSKVPHVMANAKPDSWMPAPGYDWVRPQQSLDVAWKEGLRHPSYQYLVSTETEGTWKFTNGSENGPTPAAVNDSISRIIGAIFIHPGNQASEDDGVIWAGVHTWTPEQRSVLINGEIQDMFPQLSGNNAALAGGEISRLLEGKLKAQSVVDGTEQKAFAARLRAQNVEEATADAVTDFVWRVFQAIVDADPSDQTNE